MDQFPNGALASPTKARQAAIQAKDWAYVNSWLSRHYAPKSIPPFERNEDTLRVLLALAAANDAADEEAELQNHAREGILDLCRTRKASDANDAHCRQKREILDEFEMGLDGTSRSNLEDLAGTAFVLSQCSNPTLQSLSQSVVELTVEEFDMQNQLAKVHALHQHLQREFEQLELDLRELRSNPSYETPSETQSSTSEWVRNTKILSAKVGEYQDRIALLERNQLNGPTIEEVMMEEQNVVRLRDDVRCLESHVRAFHDLPVDVTGAHAHYREMEQKLKNLRRQRDAMLDSSTDHQ
ncbi:Uncharacterized protein PECH_007586 [Penicillium ucsense]|uniref:HAUS augmin-like complex subunit 1 n=1 Tax=Penicillium ucsense TaxID=2839758 RepID=A0A8J8VXT2_9EURO|nr:Uncharacterized protein PECM_000918 [Penicillium ucsense]KAF7738881.1 Uncharacterized protein PECH_007586 [Penicillium ucsense]